MIISINFIYTRGRHYTVRIPPAEWECVKVGFFICNKDKDTSEFVFVTDVASWRRQNLMVAEEEERKREVTQGRNMYKRVEEEGGERFESESQESLLFELCGRHSPLPSPLP